MNTSTFNNNPLKNTVPLWLLSCSCNTQRCYCNARYKPDILYVTGFAYKSQPPNEPNPNLQIQFIEFTYLNGGFSIETIQQKMTKYIPLLEDISNRGWTILPTIVIIAGTRGATHIPSLEILQQEYHINKISLHETFMNINTISIQYLTSIILHKRMIENNQPLPQIGLPP